MRKIGDGERLEWECEGLIWIMRIVCLVKFQVVVRQLMGDIKQIVGYRCLEFNG